VGFRLLRGFIDKRTGVWREPSTPERTPTESRPIPAHRSPKVQGRWVHSTVEHYPFRVFVTSNCPTSRPGLTHRVFDALHRHPRASPSPIMGWCRSFATNPGSALGFSQPPGGLRKHAFHGLVSCRSQILDCLSSSVPLAEIAHPFPGRFAPLRFLTRVPNATSLTLSPPVSLNRRALPSVATGVIRCASAEFPRRLWTPFPPAEANFPIALGQTDRDRSFRELSPLRSLDPSASPFAQCRVTPTPRSLLASCPL